MWKAAAVVLLGVFGAIVSAQTASHPVRAHCPEWSHHDLASDPAVRATCRKLLESVRFGFSASEAAAFIVRNPDGTFGAVYWPPDGGPDCQRWEGPFPAGTVALVHTHRNWLPEPSCIDRQTARHT